MSWNRIYLYLSVAALGSLPVAGQEIFLEITPFVGEVTAANAVLNGDQTSNVTLTVTNLATTDFVMLDTSSVFDNTSSDFNTSDYTPPTDNLDRLVILMDGASTTFGDQATLTVAFSVPVTDPVFHFCNIDRSDFDFSPTTTSLTRLSGNSEFSVSSGRVFDADPSTTSSACGPNSANGSVRVEGTYSTITALLGKAINNTLLDGYALQISVDTGNVPVELQSFSVE